MTNATNATHPGEIIRDELEARGWSQRDLAFVLGVPENSITVILSGKRGISPEMARSLGDAFDVSAEFFLRLQTAYDLARAKQPDPGIAVKGRLQSRFPVREMIKRGWIDNLDAAGLERQLRALTEWQDGLAFAARRVESESTSLAQLAWVSRVRQIAAEMVVEKFSVAALRDAMPSIRALLSAPEEARHLPRLLAEVGVRFVIVEALSGSKIDGVCLWLNDQSPVVAVSTRYDRIDNFWFVVAHELSHVSHRHGMVEPVVDVELEGTRAGVGSDVPEHERIANTEAQSFCVPQSDMASFIARKSPYFSEADLVGFAARQRVHPGIVAGQLRYRLNNWKIFAKHLVKIRSHVAPSAVVDGWGETVPVEVA